MGFLSKIFGISNENSNMNSNKFNIDEYNNYNTIKIKEFTDKGYIYLKAGDKVDGKCLLFFRS